ncbi:hypothetical protein BH10BAC3_BH10BAC3_16810 [soil metagenome]
MKYIKGFIESNHQKFLSCLTETIYREMPGMFELTGKVAFDKEVENDYFVGGPAINIIRMIEENNIVVAQGSVNFGKKKGGFLDAIFCDVFHLKDGKIKQLTTWRMNN